MLRSIYIIIKPRPITKRGWRVIAIKSVREQIHECVHASVHWNHAELLGGSGEGGIIALSMHYMHEVGSLIHSSVLSQRCNWLVCTQMMVNLCKY